MIGKHIDLISKWKLSPILDKLDSNILNLSRVTYKNAAIRHPLIIEVKNFRTKSFIA